MKNIHPDRHETVAIFYALPDLYCVQALLDHHEIQYFSTATNHDTVEHFPLGLGGLELRVPYFEISNTMQLFDKHGYFERDDRRKFLLKKKKWKILVTAILCFAGLAPIPLYGSGVFYRFKPEVVIEDA